MAWAGALDKLHPNRRELIENMEQILLHADAMRREAESNQANLFSSDRGVIDDSIRLESLVDWVGTERLKEEFDCSAFIYQPTRLIATQPN